jgi:nitrite reductase (cytochrome c-552)
VRRNIAVFFAAAVAAFLAARWWMRQPEARPVELATFTEASIDPALWAKRFPFEYEGYRRGVRSPEFSEMRGHAYSLKEREETDRIADPRLMRVFSGRPKERPQPAACLACHGASMDFFRHMGAAASRLPFFEARREVPQPVACIDCHDPISMRLRLTRPAFLQARPHASAAEQDLRALVCAQCHAEYYLAGAERIVTHPWAKGLSAEQIEEYYDQINFRDWDHAETGAPVLKAQHPQFEMWSQGVHARSGVTCADCHMPRERRGAIHLTVHAAGSPRQTLDRSCLPCHGADAREMGARIDAIQSRTRNLSERALTALLALFDDVHRARQAGASDAQLREAQALHRKAQWRFDFVRADSSRGFHAPQESARLLAEAIDYARQGQLALQKLKPHSPQMLIQ